MVRAEAVALVGVVVAKALLIGAASYREGALTDLGGRCGTRCRLAPLRSGSGFPTSQSVTTSGVSLEAVSNAAQPLRRSQSGQVPRFDGPHVCASAEVRSLGQIRRPLKRCRTRLR